MSVFLHINDSGVAAYTDGTLQYHSPAFAVLAPKALLVGAEAYACWRSQPRLAHSSFYSQLSTRDLSVTHAHARTTADLAYAHLNFIHEQLQNQGIETAATTVFIPSHWSREQLSVLLGVASQTSFQVNILADAHAAAACTQGPYTADERLVLADMQWNHMQLVRLKIEDNGSDAPDNAAINHLSSETSEILGGAGRFSLYRSWANAITEAFIQSSRFDPLHNAVTEQYVWNHLSAWIEDFRTASESNVVIDTPAGTREAVVQKSALIAAAAQPLHEVRSQLQQMLVPGDTKSTTRARLLMNTACASLPGMQEHVIGPLQTIGVTFSAQPEAGLLECVSAHPALFQASEDAGARFLNRFPIALEKPDSTPHLLETAEPDQRPEPQRPTPPALTPPGDASIATQGQNNTAADNTDPSHLLCSDVACTLPDTLLTVGYRHCEDDPDGVRFDTPEFLSIPGMPSELCEVQHKAGQFFLRNLHASGTLVNGVLIAEQHMLASGDSIRSAETGAAVRAIRLLSPDTGERG